jgi:hypothetical protein
VTNSALDGDAAMNQRAPRFRLLFALALAAFAAPLALQAFGNGVGSYSMFTQPVLYRVRIQLTLADGTRRHLPMERVRPHVGRDARRVVGQAERWFVGETQVNLLEAGLDDLGALACKLEEGAQRVDVLLERHTVRHEPLTRTRSTVDCR